jgi:predicted small secreted protein
MPRTRRLLFVLLALSLLSLLSACNTVQGFGQDVKKAGGELEDAARKH